MKIGLDFDNTLVCYDGIFYQAALETGLIDSKEGPNIKSKEKIKSYILKQYDNNVWTQLQGQVYGKSIEQAVPFKGVEYFLEKAHANNTDLVIISHRTKHPFIGPKYDLHEVALRWLKKFPIFDTFLNRKDSQKIFLETSLTQKIERIKEQSCDYFIDDLPKCLNHENFPKETVPIYFDPNRKQNAITVQHFSDWKSFTKRFFKTN